MYAIIQGEKRSKNQSRSWFKKWIHFSTGFYFCKITCMVRCAFWLSMRGNALEETSSAIYWELFYLLPSPILAMAASQLRTPGGCSQWQGGRPVAWPPCRTVASGYNKSGFRRIRRHWQCSPPVVSRCLPQNRGCILSSIFLPSHWNEKDAKITKWLLTKANPWHGHVGHSV